MWGVCVRMCGTCACTIVSMCDGVSDVQGVCEVCVHVWYVCPCDKMCDSVSI